ncbi:MAG TPA: cysteine ABC transporter ATP-binding protein [Erysipelotrichaceae bacterium]|nr:cysteine ABC transporter ATP-binding protein [Erysipelotrichaceae bacterium]
MIDKRLISLVKESRKYIAANVFAQWIALCANILFMYAAASTFSFLEKGIYGGYAAIFALMCASGAVVLRYICMRLSSRFSFLSSRTVKKVLRRKIYEKLLRLGPSYNDHAGTSEIVQTAVEGVDQLEVYFGSYLPQFFYAMIAPVILFLVLIMVDWRAALVLLVCVPMIPVSIVFVQKWAKKLLSKYWNSYTGMGDAFLENLQGMTTLKIYQADEARNDLMNQDAESFRKATMRVLTMQLNSISVMDLVAWGGAALGMIVALRHFHNGLPLADCLLVILLAADFFLPMRQLGNFFHVAMNGMAAADKIFAFLETEEPQEGTETETDGTSLSASHLSFSYDDTREILHDVTVKAEEKCLTAVVGESGSGKSTLASLFAGEHENFSGEIRIGSTDIHTLSRRTKTDLVTYVGSHAWLFAGTVRDNLIMAKPDACDEELIEALRRTDLYDFLASQQMLDTPVAEGGANLSGGQRQRLAMARAILHDSEICVFDEAASNIDIESEEKIMSVIEAMAETKTVLLISHRLANTVRAGMIYVMDHGEIAESGTFTELMEKNGLFRKMYDRQMAYENYGKESA